MADLTVTAANVVGSDVSIGDGTAGATITAGQTVYVDATDSSKVKLADADASEAAAETKGIALHGASSGQPIRYATKGSLNPGATVTVGTIYVQSATAGGIAPSADLLAGDYVTILGVGISASLIDLDIKASGVAVPA